MIVDAVMETPRLRLRTWRESDREPFAALNADARVMEFFPACLSRAESDAGVDRVLAHFRERGFGLYATELAASAQFIGFVGLNTPEFEAHFTPCVEIGWRLTADSWGRGIATEAAQAVVRHAFEKLRITKLVSFTVPLNVRSRRVMEKLGMTHDPADDFLHPGVPEGHPLRHHVLYRIAR